MRGRPPIRRVIPEAVASVHRQLVAGFVPWFQAAPPGRFAGLLPPGGHRWVRPAGAELVDAGPVTDPEGTVLDHLVYLDTDRDTGELHRHSYGGAGITHRHEGGDQGHAHHEAEPRPSWRVRPC